MRNVVIALALLLLPFIAAAQDVMLTARQYYQDAAADVASNHGNNIVLVQVNAATDWVGIPLNLDATAVEAELWMYTFFSPDDGMLVLKVCRNMRICRSWVFYIIFVVNEKLIAGPNSFRVPHLFS